MFARRTKGKTMRLPALWKISASLCLIATVYVLFDYMTCQNRTRGDYTPVPLEDTRSVRLHGTVVQDRHRAVHQQEFNPMDMQSYGKDSFDYTAAMQKLNEEKVKQDDPRLIELIRDYYIEPPSKDPYNLSNPERLEYSNGQTPFVDSRLNYTEGGFYVECGALNGEKGSNTLFFEKVRKWNGLLIEADPDNYRVLKSKNRKAFSINACLNTQPYPALMKFNKAFNMGRIVHNKESSNWIKQLHIKENQVPVQCFPLYSILSALNQSSVDFFSLDVEGDELNVLKTIPWKMVNIKLLTVEYAHGAGSTSLLTNYMTQQGYEDLIKVSSSNWGVNDIIFRKKGLTH